MSETTSAERVLAILEMFGRERRPLALKELSEYCRIPMSTCHTLVHALLKRSYLYQSGRRKDLYPTRKIYDLGLVILEHDQVLQRLTPMMEELRDVTQETVILGKRQKDSIIYLEVRESPQTIRYSSHPGAVKPLHSTCIGKAMLSLLSPEEIRRWLEEHPPEQVTSATITSYARLMDDLEAGRRQGYFITRGENVADVTALAVKVCVNSEAYGLAVAGPSHRIGPRLDEIAAALHRARATLLDEGIAVAV